MVVEVCEEVGNRFCQIMVWFKELLYEYQLFIKVTIWPMSMGNLHPERCVKTGDTGKLFSVQFTSESYVNHFKNTHQIFNFLILAKLFPSWNVPVSSNPWDWKVYSVLLFLIQVYSCCTMYTMSFVALLLN